MLEGWYLLYIVHYAKRFSLFNKTDQWSKQGFTFFNCSILWIKYTPLLSCQKKWKPILFAFPIILFFVKTWYWWTKIVAKASQTWMETRIENPLKEKVVPCETCGTKSSGQQAFKAKGWMEPFSNLGTKYGTEVNVQVMEKKTVWQLAARNMLHIIMLALISSLVCVFIPHQAHSAREMFIMV